MIAWAWKAEIGRGSFDHRRQSRTACGDYRNVGTIPEIRLWALSDCGDYRNVDTIADWAWKAEIGRGSFDHRRQSRTACGDYRNVGTIPEIRLWALSDCGDYRNVDTIAEIRLWTL